MKCVHENSLTKFSLHLFSVHIRTIILIKNLIILQSEYFSPVDLPDNSLQSDHLW